MLTNFLQETIESIEYCGHTPNDVMFIGSKDGKYRMSWSKFVEKANFLYDSGYGSQGIASDLIIYFYDHSYLSRFEYDGSEYWEYNPVLTFKETDSHDDFDILGGDEYMWKTVEEMNEDSYIIL